MRPFAGLLVLILTAFPAAATQLQLDLQVSSVDGRARLVVRTDESTVLYPLAARSLADGTSTVTCRGEGIWCPEIAIPGDSDPLTLPVFRSMTLTGLLAGRVASSVTEGTVQGVVRNPDGRVVAEVNDDLAVTDHEFSFTGPRMPLDLRFAFEHSAPVYRWVPEPGADGEPVAELPSEMDLGAMILRPGGSVSGWTYGRDDDLPLAGAEVVAFPATSDRAPTALRTVRSISDERGFFQLHGLEAGFYRVEIQAPDRVAEVLEPVAVEATSETVVGKILLTPPLTLAVHVEPPVHPDGTPWEITLSALDQRDGEAPTVVGAGDDGFAKVERMRPTRYRVEVGRELGESLHSQTLDLVGDETTTLRVPIAQVTGRVRLGGEPIAATVVLEAGNTDRVEVESDEDGRLDGWMRRPERPWLMATVSWREGDETRRRLVEVVPTLDDDLVEVEIALPAGSVYGSVVDSQGNPRPRVRVLATPVGGASHFTEIRGRTDDDGRFHLSGLDATTYALQAGGLGGATSEVVEIDLANRLPPGEIRLVLEPVNWLSIELTADGQPLAGASVRLVGFGRVPASLHATTDARGGTRLGVPEAMARAVVTVTAPSRALWSACVRVDDAEDRLVLALPPVPSATLSIVNGGRTDLPPILGGRLVLLTGTGGFLTSNTLMAWNRDRNASYRAETDGARGTETLEIPGLVPGAYALTWSSDPEWVLAEQTCGAAFQTLDWIDLPPGGDAMLRFDTGELQARRLEALTGE